MAEGWVAVVPPGPRLGSERRGPIAKAIGAAAQVSADGAYDTIGCHQALAGRGAKVAIPPRETAVITDAGQWDAREDAVRRIGEIGRAAWKQEVNYHRRSLAETMMFRQKTIFGDHLSSRKMTSQTTEVRIRCAALNRMTHLGMPESVCISAA